MDAAISKTNERLNFVSQDKEVLRAYHMREMAQSDWTTGVNTAIEKREIEIAKNLKKMGLPDAQIAEGTGLDIETIQSLD
jgi:predicted transposase/invertase (TIGR01784 family)